MDQEKHCDTCKYSYRQMGQPPMGVNDQCCASADYNSDSYTREMMMEDWGKGYCRFWTPKRKKDKTT